MLGQAVNWDYQWGQVVGRAWSDEDFKRRLLADPARTLEEYELTAPAGRRIQVLENPERVPEDSDSVLHLILPARPSAEELSEEDLYSSGGTEPSAYCGHDWCRCYRCHCEWCRGCYAPPRPEEAN
jgi:hypothetical protein